eukprot:6458087-Amphidinium_carterae.1
MHTYGNDKAVWAICCWTFCALAWDTGVELVDHAMPGAKRQKLKHARTCAESRPGPATSEELFSWPQRIVEDLFCRGLPLFSLQNSIPFHKGDGATERRQCMLEHLDAGLIALSEFSGWDSQDQERKKNGI